MKRRSFLKALGLAPFLPVEEVTKALAPVLLEHVPYLTTETSWNAYAIGFKVTSEMMDDSHFDLLRNRIEAGRNQFARDLWEDGV